MSLINTQKTNLNDPNDIILGLNQSLSQSSHIFNYSMLIFNHTLKILMNIFKIQPPDSGIILTDAPGITDSLIKYHQGNINLENILNMYENLFASDYISPATSINMLIFAGWNIMNLLSNDSDILDYTVWKNLLRGDKKRYEIINHNIVNLFVHHGMKRRLKQYSLEYDDKQKETNMMRFNRIWMEIIPHLEKILKEDGDEILYNLGDALSYLNNIFKDIMNTNPKS